MKKISVVSGGSSGLGLEIAGQMIRHGKEVLILGRDEARLEKAGKKLVRLSEHCHASTMVCNIGNAADVKATGEYLKEHKYAVEYLFNNAGMGLFKSASESTTELIDQVFEANLKGMILLTSEVLRITPDSEELTIVNIMSTSALFGRNRESIYCAAKWGARGYTESLRIELKGTKRNIIAVYPGGMKTDFWRVTGEKRDTSEFMDPKEVAEKIVNAVMVSDKMIVTDITISRKK